MSADLAAAGFDDLRPAHAAVFQHIEADGSRLADLAERAQMTKQHRARDHRRARAEWARALGAEGIEQLRDTLAALRDL